MVITCPSIFQVLFSRLASPHVNIRLDSRPVSAAVALLEADGSDGALLMATGNKVGNHGDKTKLCPGSATKAVSLRGDTSHVLFPLQITRVPLIGPGCGQLTTCTSCLLSSRVTECGWCDGRCSRADRCPPPSVWTQDYCPPVITKVTAAASVLKLA